MRLLAVVEDDPAVQMMLQTLFSLEKGLEIVGMVANAEDALKLAEDCNPDLIILDHMLEGNLTGMEIAPQLKALCPDVRIILFSAIDLHKQAAEEPAIDIFVSKKDVIDLPEKVKALLG